MTRILAEQFFLKNIPEFLKQSMKNMLNKMPKKLLILGGTQEAYELAESLVAEFSPDQLIVISSLAGSTGNPKIPAGEVRIGGFGGLSGLINFLVMEKISMLVNATHPYASQIEKTALAATTELRLPYFRLNRSPWVKLPNDHWIEVLNMEAAANYLIDNKTVFQNELCKHKVFLTIGNRGLFFFRKCKKNNFVVRTVDPPKEASSWLEAVFLEERGPFTLENELALFRQNGITILITKNSGGSSTYAKIEAARKLRVPVIMVARPVSSLTGIYPTIDDTTDWITKTYFHEL